MCGIVGLFLKAPKLEPELGALLTNMLETMTDRGPDSAGFAIYGSPQLDATKRTLRGPFGTDFTAIAAALKEAGLESLDPAGITTQDPELMQRLDPIKAGRQLAYHLSVLTMETQIITRACGKSHVHNLEPEDLVALTMESSAMAGLS